MSYKRQIHGTRALTKMEETGAKTPADPSNKFLEIVDMGSIPSSKHEMEIW